MSFKLRYYTTEESTYSIADFFYVINLLRRIDREGICQVEVVLDRSERDIYERDMKPQTRVISKNTGRSARDWFKAGREKKNLHVYGTLAILKDNAVQWVTRYDGVVKALEYTLKERNLKSFLKEIEKHRRDQNTILNKFIQSELIKGEVKREVEVGVKLVEERHQKGEYTYEQYMFAKNVVTKRIDLVIESEREIWLIEVKLQFDSKRIEEALGQILIYKELYEMDYEPKKEVKTAVVFGAPRGFGFSMVGMAENLKMMESVFEKYGVRLFIEGRDF